MIELLLFIIAIYFIFTYWPIAVAIVVLIIGLMIYAAVKSRRNQNYVISEMPIDKTAPKISAAVSEAMYDNVKSYCSRHRMTVSDLIRNAISEYMNNNP